MSKGTAAAIRAIVWEANEWLVRLRDAEATSSDEAAFAHWLRQSPLHVREHLRAEAVWLAMEGIDAEKGIDVEALLAVESGNVVQLDRPAANTASNRPRIRTRRWYLGAMAAATATLAVVAGNLWYASQPVRYVTGLGEQRRLVLEDGSVVDMNTQTELHVRMDDSGRFIELLKGEALFSVAKDPDRPAISGRSLAKFICPLSNATRSGLKCRWRGATTITATSAALSIHRSPSSGSRLAG